MYVYVSSAISNNQILLKAMAFCPIFPFTYFVFLAANSALSMSDNFIFNGFQGASNLTLSQAARITSSGLFQLTNDTQKVIGQAFCSSPFHILNTRNTTPFAQSFSTTFVFDIITVGSRGGHGFTFAMAPSRTLPEAACGQYLGLLSANNTGNFSNHVFAIEFDTDQASFFNDTDDNHVGIDINSIISNVSQTASYYTDSSKKADMQIRSGSPNQAWIDYDGVRKILNVTISPVPIAKPRKPLISKAIDLSPILKEAMYVGFTSSTGKLTSSHYILGWSFRINGDTSALDLSQLPSPPQLQATGKSQGTKVLGLTVGVGSSLVTLVFVVLMLFVFRFLHRRSKLAETLEDWEMDYPHRFPYKDLYRATKGFKETELLGSGGFGHVYKGVLPKSGEEVAIKRISNSSRQGVKEFVAEIASLGQLRHRNLVRLQGWCKRNEDLILIYEYMHNGSLDTFLFDHAKSGLLNWEQRFKIVKDIAFGLLYLHEEWQQVVVHRDVKASNVLLDEDMNGRLGDFGLARFYERGSNLQTTRVVGTVGYLAPELTRTGKATTSTDVFAYGTLLLEVVCGRRPIEPSAPPSGLLLLDFVRESMMKGQLLEVLDRRLGESYVREEVELVLKLGLLCCQSVPEARPTMRQLTQYLDGHANLVDDCHLVFSEVDNWDLETRSYPSSGVSVWTSSV